MPDTPVHYLMHRAYTDFDALTDEAKQWDLDLCQLDAGPFRGKLTQFGIEDVHIGEARFGRTLKQEGSPPDGLRTIVVPANADVTFEWRGAGISGNHLMVFPRGAELTGISNSSFHVFTCSFPETLLSGVAETLGIVALDKLPKKADVFQCERRHMARLRQLLHGLCNQLTADETLLRDHGISECVTWELPQLIFRAASNSHGQSLVMSATKRTEIVNAAEAYIDQRLDLPLTVIEVCEELQVSIRTLQYAFSQRYGISPKQFIRAKRLNAARKMLRLSNSKEQTVVDIANDYGFWHMGQFAADYRKHFGELPSATLATCAD